MKASIETLQRGKTDNAVKQASAMAEAQNAKDKVTEAAKKAETKNEIDKTK